MKSLSNTEMNRQILCECYLFEMVENVFFLLKVECNDKDLCNTSVYKSLINKYRAKYGSVRCRRVKQKLLYMYVKQK